MGAQKAKKTSKEKKPKVSNSFIDWDGRLIAETVIILILAALFIGGCFFLYFFDFGFNEGAADALNEFFASGAEMESYIISFCAPLIISGLSILLFFSYRVLAEDDRKWLKAVLNLVYLGLVAAILYFNWYTCERIFDYPTESTVMNQVIRYIMWANSVSCGVFFLIYYSILVYVREWSKPWDIVMTVLMMTFVPVFLIVGFAVASIGAVITAIQLPGKLIQKSVDSDLASRSSRGQAYTIRNSSGYEETVYSSNGSDFYGSDGSYAGKSDDGGRTLH